MAVWSISVHNRMEFSGKPIPFVNIPLKECKRRAFNFLPCHSKMKSVVDFLCIDSLCTAARGMWAVKSAALLAAPRSTALSALFPHHGLLRLRLLKVRESISMLGF
jgi:hypothetical protein